ncbi:MAG TPA: hypothetical protein V6C88_15205 [Chroococcidiopsis sp.]
MDQPATQPPLVPAPSPVASKPEGNSGKGDRSPMRSISRRLSVPELTQQILDMGQTGVYRESVFEALRPLATKKQITQAIAHAKRFGLHSVATLRDAELGTYYQVDRVKYQASQHLIHSPSHFGQDADLSQRVVESTETVRRMLAVVKVLAIALTVVGMVCLGAGQAQLSYGLLSGALSAALVWLLQRSLVA